MRSPFNIEHSTFNISLLNVWPALCYDPPNVN
jgi:hypothetical protein